MGHRPRHDNDQLVKKKKSQDFPGGPVVKTLPPNAGGPGLTPGPGTRSHIPQKRSCMQQRRF